MEKDKTRIDDLSIGAVVLNYNGGENVLKCAQALYLQQVLLDQVILIDNGSTDNSAQIVKERYPDIELITTSENLGIAKGRNVGLERAKTDLVLLLDDDVYVQADTIEHLALSLRLNKAAVVCPRILLYPQTDIVQCDGADPHFIGNLKLRNGWTEEASLTQISTQVGGCIGACMLFDRRIIESLGNFDDEFFFYFEDLEFSLRVRALGHSIYCEPTARVLHERGGGTPELSFRGGGSYPPLRAYYTIRNRWLTILQVYKLKTIILLVPVFLLYEIGTIVFVQKNGWIKEWMRAILSLTHILNKMKRNREMIQKNRVVGDGLLLSSGDLEFAPGVIDSTFQTQVISMYSRASNLYWKFILNNFLRNG
ncbi:glycosyltransferase family 2 protein [Chloroflexota bacterium]